MTEFKGQLEATEKEKFEKLVAELRELAQKGRAGDASLTVEMIKVRISYGGLS